MIYNLKKYCAVLILVIFIFWTAGFAGCKVISEISGSAEEYQLYIDSIEGTANSLITEDILIPQVRKPTAEEAEKYQQITNLPALYIDLEETPLSSITKEIYIPAKYSLVFGEEGGIYDELMMIKGRGNYSWSFPKKPYTIKFAKPAEALGMESGRKWVLIGNHSDKTLLRNYLTLTLAKDAGLNYTSDCRYADVFFNGVYHGNYLITESIQIHENRVDIDENTEGLFEIEMVYRHEGAHEYCIEVPSGVHIMYKKPDLDDIDPEVKLQNLEIFKEFLSKTDISLGNGYDEYSQYIDVESFINWYIVNEFTKNYDSGFTTSCYCYMKDGKLYMGPVWDYDTCYGNQEVATCIKPTGYHVSTSPWFKILTKDETFKKLLCERWTELRDNGVFDNFMTRITETAEYISESEKKDHETWPKALKSKELRGSKSKYTYDEELEYLINWINLRIEWLDKEWYGQ